MLKKLLYIIMTGIMALFIYNNYIKPPEPLEIPKTENDVETENISYNVGKNYKIEANTVTEKPKEEITNFDTARAFFQGLQIKGKNAILDRYKNLILQGNILGKSKYGIEFKTDEIRYDDSKKIFYSDKKFIITQKIRKLSLEGDSFESNQDFNIITLKGNIKANYDNIDVSCDRMIYEREQKIIRLFENIKFSAKNLETEKGLIEKIEGTASYAIYDMNAETMTSWGKFKFYYKDFTFEGNNFYFERKTGTFTAHDDLKLKKNDLIGYADRLTYNNDTKKISITGNIRSVKDSYNFMSDNLDIDIEKETFLFTGNPMAYNEENQIFATEVLYNQKEDKLYLKGQKTENIQQNVRFVNKSYTAESMQAIYNLKEDKLYVESDFTGYIKDDKIELRGKYLDYSVKNNKGIAKNFSIQKDKNKITGNILEFDTKTETATATGDVVAYYEEYLFKSQKGYLDNKNQIVSTPERFTIIDQKEKINLSGTDGMFNNKTKEIKINRDVEVIKDKRRIKGDRLFYNINKEDGYVEGNVKINDGENGNIECEKLTYINRKELILSTDSIVEKKGPYLSDFEYITMKKNTIFDIWKDTIPLFENKKYEIKKELKFLGNVKLTKNEYLINSRNVIYDTTAKIVYFDYPSELINNKENFISSAERARYDENTKILYTYNIKGSKDVEQKNKKYKVFFKGGEGLFDETREMFFIRNNVEFKIETINVSSKEVVYYIKSGDLVSKDEIKVKEKNLLLTGSTGKINTKNKTIEASKVVMTTDSGDKLTGDSLTGDYELKEFNFKDNLKAELRDKSKFSGELAKVFFYEDDEDYKVSRGEIKNKTNFVYRDMSLDAEYIELDNVKKFVYGKQNPKLKILDETEATANYIYLDIPQENGQMESDVKITHKNKEYGTVNSKSDRATLKNKEKVIELEGHVKVFQNKNEVETDKGWLNLKTNELWGDGNINFKYKIEKADKKTTPESINITKSAINITTKSGISTNSSIDMTTKSIINITTKSGTSIGTTINLKK